MKKLTQEQVINDFHEVHGYEYDYSEFEYINDKTSSTIICSKHGRFTQRANDHKRGQKCPKCAGRGLSDCERVKEYNEIHNYKFKYPNYKYNGPKGVIEILCKKHGSFKQQHNNHRNGQGCPGCIGYYLSDSVRVEEYNEIHNCKFKYPNYKYNGSNSEIDIECSEYGHGLFKLKHNSHRNGVGCPKCAGHNLTNSEWVERFKEVHGDLWNYTLFIYMGADVKSTFICPKHGDFNQIPNSHLQGTGCPVCKMSKGERKTLLYLKSNNISVESQFGFNECIYIRKLPFDFYLPDYNMCIEYDGVQHFKPVDYGGKGNEYAINLFQYIKRNDKIKNKFCKDNNIKLIRISYWDFNNIEKILKKELTL